jgi:hypothetical protein
VNLKLCRLGARLRRDKDDEARRRLRVDKNSIAKLRKKTRPVIKSLERAMKRANRRFVREVSKKELESQSKQWQAHLRWMKYHILYFKPMPGNGLRRLHQLRIDKLVAIAKAGLEDFDYELPSDKELRRMMRMYLRYSRRGRMGELEHHVTLLREPEAWNSQSVLVAFLEKRLQLKRVSDEPVIISGQPAQEVPKTAAPPTPPAKAPVENRRRPKLKLSPAQKRRWAEYMKRRSRPTQTSPS